MNRINFFDFILFTLGLSLIALLLVIFILFNHLDESLTLGHTNLALIALLAATFVFLIGMIARNVRSNQLGERALLESESKFKTIANAMPQMVWSTLPDGYHDYYNDRWYEFTGMPHGSTDGDGWNGMFHPDDQPKARERWSHSLSTGEPYEIEYRLRHHSGEYHWTLGRALPIRDHNGKIIRWMGTCTDIHQQKVQQTEIEAIAVRLQSAIAARDEFVSIASHELKTPLSSLKMQAQLFLRGLDKGDENVVSQSRLHQMADHNIRQVTRLTRLVDDMLDVARVRTGRLNVEFDQVDVQSLVVETIERLASEFQQSRSTRPHLSMPETSILAFWDRGRVEQVVTNLLTNAIRYGKGSPIYLKVADLDHEVLISVKDQGIGISKENQLKIFDRFERAADSHEIQGLGLGLYITKQIVLSHKGKIWVESVLNEGSTFHVQLPKSPT